MPMQQAEQYKLIEPDTLIDVLKERGWVYIEEVCVRGESESVYGKDASRIHIADGDQRLD